MQERHGDQFEGRRIWSVCSLLHYRCLTHVGYFPKNEYSKQIKEYRAQENPGKAYGRVLGKGRFVCCSSISFANHNYTVLGIKGIHLPLPSQPTVLTCTLNNGINFVSTPECQLGRD